MEPFYCDWDGEAFRPLARYARQCDAKFVVGVRYVVEAELPRNMQAHKAYFSGLKEIWDSLPDGVAEQFPSSDHMRKHALCRTGYCGETKSVFTSHRDALLAAAFAIANKQFAIVDVEKNVVLCWVPESQSVAAMGAERFKASCAEVERYCLGLVGVALVDASERSAA